jgi:hypothetical protein
MELILHNDNEHSFDYVYATLMREAKHLPIQAISCITIIENKGQCCIKVGKLDDLIDLKHRLETYQLKLTLE